MKKLFVSALAMLAVALGFTACSSEDELVKETPAQGKQITVIASTEEPAQRTALGTQGTDGTYPVFWSPNDKIKIGGKEFTLKSGDGTSTGVFEGEAPAAGTYTAYYPSTYDGTWPAAQTYVANNIPLGVPMKAENIEVDEGKISPIKFYNEGGILRLNLKGTAKVASITVCATDLNAITLNCGEGVQLDKEKATPFHIAVPYKNYPGLNIVITDDAGKVCVKSLKSDKTIIVRRRMITDITLTAGSFAPAGSIGFANATINSVVTLLKWIQLWAGGHKFAEYNVGANSKTDAGTTMTIADAIKTGSDYVWGANWRTPSRDDMDELLLAATNDGSSKVICEYMQEDGKWGFKFTGKGDYAVNSLFIPADKGLSGNFGGAVDVWSGTYTSSGDNLWVMNLFINHDNWSSIWHPDDQTCKYFVRPVLVEAPASE